MTYDCTITFTLDTICPWTYIALTRLQHALTTYTTTHASSPAPATVTFTLRLAPYQLYPSAPLAGENKHAWYRDTRYASSEERYGKYAAYMAALGKDAGIAIDFSDETALIANTFPAHRVLYVLQEEYGAEAAVKGLGALYRVYFGEGGHPSDDAALGEACRAAGLGEEEVRRVVGDGERGERGTREVLREQVGNGVDSVPYVVFEGRKRDFTLIGAKEVGEYVKIMEQVAKEAV